MKNIFTFLLLVFIGGQFLWGQPANLVWNTQSRNASESMPCGGGDIGMNVWVENDDVLFYLSRSGSFDENNCLLKQGRFRVRLTPNPFAGTASFRQTLHLNDGYVSVSSDNATLIIWVDVFHPVVHVEVKTKELTSMRVNFESWRYEDRPVRKGEGQQCSYKWAIPDGLYSCSFTSFIPCWSTTTSKIVRSGLRWKKVKLSSSTQTESRLVINPSGMAHL